MGSSVAFIVLLACSANLHPRQPGNSKAQNSPCAPLAVPSAEAISNRHLNGTVVSWTMMHPYLRRECDTPSHRLMLMLMSMTVKRWNLPEYKKASPVPDIFCENSWATTEPRTISDLKNNAPTKQTTGPDRA